ncbi:hypothetical protein KUCAC02_020290, partial [Chaenocephalus aceratus]
MERAECQLWGRASPPPLPPEQNTPHIEYRLSPAALAFCLFEPVHQYVPHLLSPVPCDNLAADAVCEKYGA